jgi:FAD/FMN-containing dehydrogenase
MVATRTRHWAEIAGDDVALAADADTTAYETDARHGAGRAATVLRPASTAAVSALVAHCVAHGVPFVVQSANTGLVGGSTPDASGDQVVISLERLTGGYALNADNRCVRAGAGMRLSALNARLAEAGLFFPIDLASDPMLGGMVATNTGGARFLRYGDVRANTLGLTVVLADAEGTVLRLDRGLRKDNTGPDWKQLFIGSSGAFGIVTECVFNVEPLPRQRAAALLVPAGDAAVFELLRALETRLGAGLSAFELMSGNAMRHALAHNPGLRNPFSQDAIPPLALLVEVTAAGEAPADGPTLAGEFEQVLAGIWEQPDTPLVDALFGAPEEIWALRHALSSGVQQAGRLFAFDLAFERRDVMAFRAAMHAELPAAWPELEICDFGHVGDGGLHFSLVCADPEQCRGDDYARRLQDWVFDRAVHRFGASFSGEHGIGRTNQRQYDRYTPDRLKTLADRLTAALGATPAGGARFGHE